jgi:TolB-like protein
LLLVASLLGWSWSERQSSAPQLSVLVLPFTTLGTDDSTPAGLGAVVASDLTGALAKLRGASVIAADSARVLLGRSWDPRDLGRDWHVRHVVSGSLARSERGWRINAQLIDTATGANRWADRFDVDRQDLGPALDTIVLRLAGALGAELVQSAARQPLRDAAAADAETLAMRCEAATFTRVDQSAQPDLAACDQALARDPGNVRALSTLAYFHATRVSRVQSPDAKADLALARQQVDLALAAAPDDHAVHCAHSVVLEGETRLTEAVVAAERCLALNPSAARAYLKLATLYFFLAQPERSIAYAERGLQLSPRDTEASTFVLFEGWAHFMLGHDQDALRWLRRAAAAAPRSPNVLAALASLLALSGDDAEARTTLARYLALPETRARTIAQWNYRPGSSPAFLAFDQRFKSGLRLAGLPER